MSNTEAWGIVLRDRASGAEQWVACEVRLELYRYVATAHGYDSVPKELAFAAAESVGHIIAQNNRSLSFVRVAYPAQYAAHMADVRSSLAVDEVERLRNEIAAHEIASMHLRNAMTEASVADACDLPDAITDLRARLAEAEATIADLRHASNRAAVAWAESLARNDAAAFTRGAEAMREAAAGDIAGWWQIFASEAATAASCIRALPLPTEATPPPAQSHEATATPDAPLTIADAAARAINEVARAPRWLAPYLRPSPPTVEQIEAHRDRVDPHGVLSWWWVCFAGDAPMRVSFQVMRPKNYVRELPKGDPPWVWGCWPDVARTMVYEARSITSEELRSIDGLGRAYVAPCDVVGNPMEWP